MSAAPSKLILKRLALCLVPAALAAAGMALLIAGPFSWDAGRSVDAEPWWPMNTALAWGLPYLALGGICAVKVWRRTTYRVTVFVPQLLAALPVVFVAVSGFAYAALLPDPGAYGECSLTGARGNFCEGPVLPLFVQTPPASWLTSLVTSVFVAAMLYIYLEAIAKDKPSRFDRRDGEVDAIGSMLQHPSER